MGLSPLAGPGSGQAVDNNRQAAAKAAFFPSAAKRARPAFNGLMPGNPAFPGWRGALPNRAWERPLPHCGKPLADKQKPGTACRV